MLNVRTLRTLYMLFIGLCYVSAIRTELFRFPGSYQFNEWMISYAGGFVRRGLAGEVLFHLNSLVRMDILLPAVLLVCILYVAVRIFDRLAELKLGAFWNICLLFSPGLFLFCLQDISCLRRELACYAVIVFSLELSLKDCSPYLKLAVILLLTWLTLLIYEPFAVWIPLLMLGIERAGGRKSALIYAAASCIPLLFLVMLPADPKQADLIAEAWRSCFPDLPAKIDPFVYIGMPVEKYYEIYGYFWSVMHFLKCLTAGCFLCFLPFVLLYSSGRAVFRKETSLIPPFVVILTPLVVMLILGYDMGRWLNFSAMTALMMLCYFSSNTGSSSDRVTGTAGSAPWMLMICYLLCWHMKEIGPVVQFGNFDQYLSLIHLML